MAGVVDSERVLVELKALVASKPSHGGRDLLAAIAALEAEHRIPHDEMEAFARRMSHHFVDSFMGILPHADEDDGPPTAAEMMSAGAVAGSPHLRRSTNTEVSPQCPQTPRAARAPLRT